MRMATACLMRASMRPRQLRLGYPPLAVALDHLRAASMRPRQLRLGYADCCCPAHRTTGRFNEAEAITPRIRCNPAAGAARSQASMRPRQLRLGYTTIRSPPAAARIRFNEAEAITPRILGLRLPQIILVHRFNEAEAITPRIPGGPGKRAGRFLAASMRPRQLRLGYPARLSCPWPRPKCFNEAEAITPRIRDSGSSNMARVDELQ